MKKLTERTALATVFSNIRRKARGKDLVTVGEAVEYLVRLYGSQKATSKKIGLSTEMIRQFLAVLKLPEKVQMLFRVRRLDSVDVAKELLALKNDREKIAAGHALVASSSKEVRDIKRVMKRGGTSAQQAKKLIMQLKPKGLHVFLVDFDEATYSAISKGAKANGLRAPEYVRKIVTDYMKRKRTRRS